jgi:hypothetical protein
MPCLIAWVLAKRVFSKATIVASMLERTMPYAPQGTETFNPLPIVASTLS